MAQSKKLLLLSVLLCSSLSPIFGMKHSLDKIFSTWPFFKFGLAAGSVALASYCAYKYFNEKDTEPNPKTPFDNQSSPIEQIADSASTSYNGKTFDKDTHSDSDESLDNIPYDKIQVRKPIDVKKIKEKLIRSSWFSSEIITFDLENENLAQIKHQFTDIEQINCEIQEMSLDKEVKNKYQKIPVLERCALLNNKIFPAIQDSLNIDKKILSDLAAFIAISGAGETSASLDVMSSKTTKILKKLKLIRTVFKHTQDKITDSNNKIILLAIHGTWSNTASYGYNREDELSQAIINFAQSLAHMRQCSVELWSIGWSGNWSIIDRQISGACISILLSLERFKEQVDEIWTIAHSHGCNVSNAIIASQPNCCIGIEIKQPKIYAIHLASPIWDDYINKENLFQNMCRLYNCYRTEDSVVKWDARAQGKKYEPEIFGKTKIYNCKIVGTFTKQSGYFQTGIDEHSLFKLPVIQQLPLLLMHLEQIYECYGDLDVKLFATCAYKSINRPIISISSNYEKLGSREIYNSSIIPKPVDQVNFEIQYSEHEKSRSIMNVKLDDDWEYVDLASLEKNSEHNFRA